MQTAHAQLRWERTVIDLHPAEDAQTVEAAFAFTNTGAAPVTILLLKPNCSCTTSTSDKKTYASGEKGTIMAKITLGTLAGQHTKNILVLTDSKTDNQTILKLNLTVPELVAIEPNRLSWELNDELATKAVTLSAPKSNPEKSLNVLAISTADKRLTAKLSETVSGKEYQLAITPTDLTKPFAGTIRIQVACAGGKSKWFEVFAKVGNPPESGDHPQP